MTTVMILIDAVLWVSIITFIVGIFGIIKYNEPSSVLLAACGFWMAICITLMSDFDFGRLPPTIEWIGSLLK